MKKLVIHGYETPFGFVGKIVEQTCRGVEFANGVLGPSGTFGASKVRYSLHSGLSPQASGRQLYVRGTVVGRDEDAFLIQLHELDLLKEAVREYNETYKSDPEPIERMVKLLIIE